ncbi:MAG: mechanosensitive ion channel family protein [Candidatus Nanopelagicales bacterium]
MSLLAAQQTTWESVLEWFLGNPLRILIIVVAAVVVQRVLSRVVLRLVRRATAQARKQRPVQEKRAAHTSELTDLVMSERREQRAQAIGQLVRSVIAIVVWGTAVLMILPLLGVDIAPLLASAGVVGVALGFGAQTLVKDYLSGLFLIIEDQFGVGDLVDLGPVVGTVEEVTLRVTRVRDLTGVVWYVRNGEILRVANRSQGWTVAIVDVPVAYDENLDRVREIVDAVGRDMDGDEQYDEMLLGAPSYAGVESVSGEAVFVRITAKAAPDKQIPAARAIRERVKAAFDRAGVRVPVLMRGMPPGPGSPGGSGAGGGQGAG